MSGGLGYECELASRSHHPPSGEYLYISGGLGYEWELASRSNSSRLAEWLHTTGGGCQVAPIG